MRIYFATRATHGQEQTVQTRVEKVTCVKKVVFVSKAEALRQMKKKFPDLFTTMHGNPLPDTLEIAPAQASCSTQIAATVRAAHWPGVHSIKLSRKPVSGDA